MKPEHKEKDYFKDRKSLKGVPDLRRHNNELKRKQSEGMRRYQAKIKNNTMRQEKVYEYLEGLEVNSRHAEWLPNNCAIIERTGDGISLGSCSFYLEDGITCPRHGKVRRLSRSKDCGYG